MKTISLTQPYATLIALGAKKIETRSWSTSFRGPLAIHAAKGPGDLGWMQMNHLCRNVEPFKSALNLDRHPADALPLGAIVAVCTLRYCYPMPDDGSIGWQHNSDEWIITDQERAFGDYSPDRFAWLLADIRALPEPIVCKGKLGLWEWDGEL